MSTETGINSFVRFVLRGVQSASAHMANLGHEPAAASNAHDLLKAAWMARHIPSDAQVLDVGCGNGRRLMDLGMYVPGLKATGVDVRRCPQGPHPVSAFQPTIMEFDGEHLPFDDDAFDVSMVCYVLHHLSADHCDRLLGEVARVTQQRILILEDSRPEFSAAYRLRNWAHATEANLEYASQSEAFKPNHEHVFRTHSDWCGYLSQVDGVEQVTCEPLDTIARYKHHTLFVADLRLP